MASRGCYRGAATGQGFRLRRLVTSIPGVAKDALEEQVQNPACCQPGRWRVIGGVGAVLGFIPP